MTFSSANRRGFTLAEMLTVIALIALFVAAFMGVLVPIMHASAAGQVKTSTLEAAAQGFYQIQRDVRQAHAGSVYLCDSGGAGCSNNGPVNAIVAVPAALDPSGNVSISSGQSGGQVIWKGFIVYWVAGGTLYKVFEAPPNISQPPSAADASAAATAALAASSPAVLATDISALAVNVDVAGSTVSLKLTSTASVSGQTNRTSYQSNTFARN